MKNVDLEYICRVIGNLAGIPVRIFKNRSMTYCYSMVNFPVDPISPYVDKVFEIKSNVGYFITPYFNYYGIVNSKDFAIVIGPSRQTPMSEMDVRTLAFDCGVDGERIDEFISSMRALVEMPLGSILQILCTINYILNKEKLSLEDVSIYDFDQMEIESVLANESVSADPDTERAQSAVHNTFTLEQTLMQMISKGDVGALCEWLSRAPSIRGGVIANDALRQIKNTFIVTATLASRAAINGGLDIESSLSLSDNYIKKCELLSDVKDIFNLQYHMILDYTRKVERVRLGKTPSKLLMQVTNYVQKNLSKPTDVDELAKEMYISRTHLASKFKKETGMTLSDFILKEKTEEAKRLLRYSDKPLCLIGEYLGFSSQSHFNRTFKKYTGKTPGEYRQSNK